MKQKWRKYKKSEKIKLTRNYEPWSKPKNKNKKCGSKGNENKKQQKKVNEKGK